MTGRQSRRRVLGLLGATAGGLAGCSSGGPSDSTTGGTDGSTTTGRAATGTGSTGADVPFSRTTLDEIGVTRPTVLAVGPDGRLYVAARSGRLAALAVERTDDGTYRVERETAVDAVRAIPNHDDSGRYVPDERGRQVTGLAAGGDPGRPVLYVTSSDPTPRTEHGGDGTDTNSGTISKLAFEWGKDGTLRTVEHELLVAGLPRSDRGHATNGLALDDAAARLYVAQGGNTNRGAPSEPFRYTPEYALAGAVLAVDLASLTAEHAATSLRSVDSTSSGSPYPDLALRYALPTVQGGPLPFGGRGGRNMAALDRTGPVRVHSPGYRNPYDLTLTHDGRLYTADNGPDTGHGGPPIHEAERGCTNRPNDGGDYDTVDQLHRVEAGFYAGHPNPTRANPDGVGVYDAAGNRVTEFDAEDTPVPFEAADPRQCEYREPGNADRPGVTASDGALATFAPTGGLVAYRAGNFDGALRGDLLVVELYGTVHRVRLASGGDAVASVDRLLAAEGALGVAAQADDEPFPGTVWTANFGADSVSVFEPADYGR